MLYCTPEILRVSISTPAWHSSLETSLVDPHPRQASTTYTCKKPALHTLTHHRAYLVAEWTCLPPRHPRVLLLRGAATDRVKVLSFAASSPPPLLRAAGFPLRETPFGRALVGERGALHLIPIPDGDADAHVDRLLADLRLAGMGCGRSEVALNDLGDAQWAFATRYNVLLPRLQRGAFCGCLERPHELDFAGSAQTLFVQRINALATRLVVMVQRALSLLGLLTRDPVLGCLCDATLAALIDFEIEEGGSATRHLRPATVDRLFATVSTAARRLRAANYPINSCPVQQPSSFESAILRLQSDHNLNQTGVLDEATRTHIGSLLAQPVISCVEKGRSLAQGEPADGIEAQLLLQLSSLTGTKSDGLVRHRAVATPISPATALPVVLEAHEQLILLPEGGGAFSLAPDAFPSTTGLEPVGEPLTLRGFVAHFRLDCVGQAAGVRPVLISETGEESDEVRVRAYRCSSDISAEQVAFLERHFVDRADPSLSVRRFEQGRIVVASRVWLLAISTTLVEVPGGDVLTALPRVESAVALVRLSVLSPFTSTASLPPDESLVKMLCEHYPDAEPIVHDIADIPAFVAMVRAALAHLQYLPLDRAAGRWLDVEATDAIARLAGSPGPLTPQTWRTITAALCEQQRRLAELGHSRKGLDPVHDYSAFHTEMRQLHTRFGMDPSICDHELLALFLRSDLTPMSVVSLIADERDALLRSVMTLQTSANGQGELYRTLLTDQDMAGTLVKDLRGTLGEFTGSLAAYTRQLEEDERFFEKLDRSFTQALDIVKEHEFTLNTAFAKAKTIEANFDRIERARKSSHFLMNALQMLVILVAFLIFVVSKTADIVWNVLKGKQNAADGFSELASVMLQETSRTASQAVDITTSNTSKKGVND